MTLRQHYDSQKFVSGAILYRVIKCKKTDVLKISYCFQLYFGLESGKMQE